MKYESGRQASGLSRYQKPGMISSVKWRSSRKVQYMTQLKITDDLDALLGILPGNIVEAVHKANDYDNLLEIILDLGRVPTARYVLGRDSIDQQGNHPRRTRPRGRAHRRVRRGQPRRARAHPAPHFLPAQPARAYRRSHLPRRARRLRDGGHHPGHRRVGQEPAHPGPPRAWARPRCCARPPAFWQS